MFQILKAQIQSSSVSAEYILHKQVSVMYSVVYNTVFLLISSIFLFYTSCLCFLKPHFNMMLYMYKAGAYSLLSLHVLLVHLQDCASQIMGLNLHQPACILILSCPPPPKKTSNSGSKVMEVKLGVQDLFRDLGQLLLTCLLHTVPTVSCLSGKNFVMLRIRCELVLFLLSLSQVWVRGRRLIPFCWGRWLLSSPHCPQWREGSSHSSQLHGCHTGIAAAWTSAPSGSCCWGSRTPQGWCRWRPSLLSGRQKR